MFSTKNMTAIAVTGLTLLVFPIRHGVFAQSPAGAVITPIPGVQDGFRELVELSLDTPYTTEAQLKYNDTVKSLIDALGGNRVTLLQQWIYAYDTYVRNLEMKRRSDVAITMQGLWNVFGITFEDVGYAFYPLLDSPDEDFVELLKPFLERGISKDSIDFGVYERILIESYQRTGTVPIGLTEYLYEKVPVLRY